MIDFVPVSLANSRPRPPSGPDWVHEIKFDGYRIEARLDHGKVTLWTRGKQDWAHRYEPVAEAIAALPVQEALLDGELVVEDDNGISSFNLLQQAAYSKTARLVYNVFDLLYLDGQDLTKMPLIERKARLQALMAEVSDERLRYVEYLEGDGESIFNAARKLGLEGIVSKRKNAPYRSGRTDNFIKSKICHAQEFVVVGFVPHAAIANAVGALAVAVYEDGQLRPVGRVGTGYTHQTAKDLFQLLNALRTDTPAVPSANERGTVWVRPEVVVVAEYRGISESGIIRQAAFKGLREDKAAREIVLEPSGGH